MVVNPIYEDTSSHVQTNQNTSFAEFLFHTVANQSHVQKMADVSCSHDTKNNYENYSPKLPGKYLNLTNILEFFRGKKHSIYFVRLNPFKLLYVIKLLMVR